MLRRLFITGSIVLLALPLAAQQQDNSAPPAQQGPPSTPAPQKKDQPKKSTSDQNPFPEAQSEAAAHQSQQDSSSQPDASKPQTATPASPSTRPDSPDQNPFPEAQSEKAAHQTQPQDKKSLPPAPAGSKDDENYSSSQVKGLDMPTTDEAAPANLPPSSLPYNPKLAKKDSGIGDFYMDSGNWKGAYDRFLEANHSDPGNAEAVFGLAESARHLGHQDEALRNYRLYLAALPNGPHAKEVRKALKEMGAAPPA
jgi:tetratricopeptide (TPR) repeat protein